MGGGVGEAVGSGVGLAVGSGVGDTAAVGPRLGASVGSRLTAGEGVTTTATSVGAGVVSTTGRSMPPRWTTKPNEIPALSTSTRSAASVARGTAP